jgi:hypothetical protein
MTAVLYYVDIYLVLVKAFTPSYAGIQLLFYTPGIGGESPQLSSTRYSTHKSKLAFT